MNAATLVTDDLWEAIEPLLPQEPSKSKGDRPASRTAPRSLASSSSSAPAAAVWAPATGGGPTCSKGYYTLPAP